ncbi:MAG: hypothetical protein HKN89_04830 [Eudoraea sp.]|nr:hypothetical protein [Eudoraea sp.]
MSLRSFLFSSVLLVSLYGYSQKNIYESGRFEELSKDHKVLAIIPFITHLDLEENISRNEYKKLEEKEGYEVQNALETYFGRGNKRKKFSVDFQNIKNTNAILLQNDITYKNIDTYTIKQLCKLLEVDGIISGNMDLTILLSKGVPTNFNFMDYITGKSDYGRIGIKISDGATGKLLWKYEKEINKKSGRNTVELIDKMMKKATRRFPYEKERL